MSTQISKITQKNPSSTANPINKLFFWWTLKLFKKGTNRSLTMEDLYRPLASDESELLANRLENAWNEEVKKTRGIIKHNIEKNNNVNQKSKNPSLINAIFRTFWAEYSFIGLLLLFQSAVLRILQPTLQGWIISYFDNTNDDNAMTKHEAINCIIGLISTVLGILFIEHHMNIACQQIGMRIRVACCSVMYRKSLKLSKVTLNTTAAGQMINLLSNDVNRFDILPMFFHFLWIMPIQMVVMCYVMWRAVGVSAFIGISALLIMAIPLQSSISSICGKLRAPIAELTDRRVQLISELVTGIQTIKMYAWEKPISNIVKQIRLLEIKLISKSSYLQGVYFSLIVFTDRTGLFITLVAYILMGNAMNAHTTFSLAGYFNILQMVAVIFFPKALLLCSEALTSIARIEDFLLLDEISNRSSMISSHTKVLMEQSKKLTNTVSTPVSVEFERVSASWVIGQLPPTLCDVSFKIIGGQLYGIVGSVGAGKSSLFNVLLQELPHGAGTIKLLQSDNYQCSNSIKNLKFIKDNPGLTISYASQDPWLFSGTVRENILFGQIYEQSRYQEVVKVCSLVRDLEQLPHGDLTIIGDRGASLSGGQRARINLARAIYRQADLYLLDDPLSAVDARVARRLFDDCILHYLKGKTRILITHQIHFLREADNIAVLERGFVKETGTFISLKKNSCCFNELLDQLNEDDENKSEDTLSNNDDDEDDDDEISANVDDEVKGVKSHQEKNFHRRTTLRNSRKISTKSHHSHILEISSEVDTEVNDEITASGKIPTGIIIRYFRSGNSIPLLILLLLIFVISQIAISGGDFWLSYWSNLEHVRYCYNNAKSHCTAIEKEYHSIVNDTLLGFFSVLDADGLLPRNYAIYIYTFCIIFCIIITICRNLFFMKICMNSGKKLYENMFFNIIHTTLFFFNTNPSGRILNRFSKDIGLMDEMLPKAALEAIQIFLIMMGILVIIAILNPWMIIPIIIIIIIYFIIQKYALHIIHGIKRLEGTAKSPVLSHVSNTLNGLTTIRSRGLDVQLMLCKQFDEYQNDHSGSWYLAIVTATAFGFTLDLLCCIFISCICFSFIFIDRGNGFGGYVGLSMTQSLILTGMVQYGVSLLSEIQAQISSVERILQYTNLPKERSIKSSPPLPDNWPLHGQIQMKNVFMSYKFNDPPVLKNVNFILEGGWKVGVVGRTGAGKSSILTALFRLADDGLQGEIIIDGIDSKCVELEQLRKRISIIPQQPVLFSESLRYNLDPYGQYSDDTLCDALKEVELNNASLDQRVNEGGTNFSVGQRQLICLARAILRNNRILVLDEATANIDSKTDTLIQRTIRSKFANCTVITIAHRLNTIIDSDRVLVMENGRIVEFDSPYELIFGNPDGYFSQMIQQTGEAMAKKLLEDAKMYHNLRLQPTQKNVTSHQDSNTIDKEISDSISL